MVLHLPSGAGFGDAWRYSCVLGYHNLRQVELSGCLCRYLCHAGIFQRPATLLVMLAKGVTIPLSLFNSFKEAVIHCALNQVVEANLVSFTASVDEAGLHRLAPEPQLASVQVLSNLLPLSEASRVSSLSSKLVSHPVLFGRGGRFNQ